MKLHHIGFVVKNLEQYEKSLIHNGKIKEVIDSIQNARLSLYQGFGDYFIEIIQPINEDSFTWDFSKKNSNSYHHSCFEMNTIDSVIDFAKKNRLLQLLGPVPATLFDGRNVMFFYDRNKNIIEFLIK
jgi:hypothetical protein